MGEWNRAVNWDHKIRQWVKDNPKATWQQRTQWEKQQGIPGISKPGRLYRVGPSEHDYWCLRLTEPAFHGNYIIKCPDCGTLHRKTHPSINNGRCNDCQEKVQQQRAEVKADRQRERRKEASEELRNRKGKCLVCGTEMTVARGSKRTCRERCKKALQRHPERYRLPDTPTTYSSDLVGNNKPLARAFELLKNTVGVRSQLLKQRLYADLDQRLGDGTFMQQLERAEANDAIYQTAWTQLMEVARLEELAELRETAPAIFLLKRESPASS